MTHQRPAPDDLAATVHRLIDACHRRHGAPLAPHDLEEARQDTLVAIWRGGETYRGRGSFDSWVYTIARRSILGVLRRRRRVDSREHPGLDGTVEQATTAPGPSTDADTGFARAVRDEVRRAGPTVFDIVTSRDIEGASFETIARRRSMSVTAVKSRYYRSRPGLVRRLADLWSLLG